MKTNNYKTIFYLLKLRFHNYITNLTTANKLFLLVCIVISTFIFTATLLLNTPEGIKMGSSILPQKGYSFVVDQTKEIAHNTIFKENVEEDKREEIKENVYITLLENQKLIKNKTIVYINAIDKLSQKQKDLFNFQNIDIRSLNKKEKEDYKNKISNGTDNILWVAYNKKDKWWLISVYDNHFKKVNSSSYNDDLTNVDVVKLILWYPQIKKRDLWLSKNPPPKLPKSLKLSHINLNLIPSDEVFHTIYWIAVIFSALFFSAISMVFTLSYWDKMRNDGVLQPLMTIPFATETLVWSYTGLRMINTFLLLVISFSLSSLIIFALGISYHVVDAFKSLLLFILISFSTISSVTLISSWFNTKWWKISTHIIINFIALFIEIIYVSLIFSHKNIVLYLDTPYYFVFCLIVSIYIFMIHRVIAMRLDKNNRRGFIKT